MLSHMNLGYVDLSKIDVLILDEADRMLDMGFLGDINRITEHCNPNRQTLLYSATMPERISKLATTMLKDPVTVQIALSRPAEKVMQVAYPVHDDQKPKLLVSLLKDRGLESVIVFSSRKRSISIIARSLVQSWIERRLHQFRPGPKGPRRRDAPFPEPQSPRTGGHRRGEPGHRHRQHRDGHQL